MKLLVILFLSLLVILGSNYYLLGKPSTVTEPTNTSSCKKINFNIVLNNSELKTYHKYIKRYTNDSQLKRNYLKHREDYLWIREQLRKNNLPPDLVYIIVVESTMNPKLRSGRYHGIWQMSKYHCKGNDIKCLYSYRESTKFAIKYLLELQQIFKNNHRLMIYGYNCGYGKILGIMKRNHNMVPFHKLPKITKLYIPKMLAAKHVLENVFPAAKFDKNGKRKLKQPEW